MDHIFPNIFEDFKSQFRTLLMDKTEEERFKILREDFSMEGLKMIEAWAIEVEDMK